MSNDVKDAVRDHYAEIARTADGLPSLGLGDVVALAGLRAGETVLDLGSGPGKDLLQAAGKVGPSGRSIGVDMTPEMRARSTAEAERQGLANVSVIAGDLEGLPLPCGSVDVVISNCVINLVPDKAGALAEAYRVLAPGGRFAVLDTVFETEPTPEMRADMRRLCGCEAGALVAADYERLLTDIGFTDVRIQVNDLGCGSTKSAAVTASKPGTPGDPIRPALPHEDATFVAPGRGRITLDRTGTAAIIRKLHVDEAHRDDGTGIRLVVAALEAARWSGVEEVFAQTETAQPFFEKLGFKPVSRARATAAGVPTDECPITLRTSFDDTPVALLDARKPLPTFQDGACC